MSVVFLSTAALLGLAAHQLGLFDRPTFSLKETLVGKEFVCVMAFKSDKNIGKHIVRLIEGVSKGIKNGLPNGALLFRECG